MLVQKQIILETTVETNMKGTKIQNSWEFKVLNEILWYFHSFCLLVCKPEVFLLNCK